jgi:hypothetical protein
MKVADVIAAKILCVATFATAVLIAAQAQDIIRNPSGSCGTRSDGTRAGYHYALNDLWVPDCQNPLRREYWRVFVKNGDEAYVIPRPDGAPELHAICTAGQDELRRIVDQHGLCAVAASSEQVRTVNTMDLSGALRITHFLHGQLKFSVVVHSSGHVSIRPFPIPSDVSDACAIRPHMISAELEVLYCERARHPDRLLLIHTNREAADDLASRLNDLYGVK